ncbi:MAG: metallophosphoesterase family protein [Deltaproteobacteria bacterium]|nr:MAG: metallophosphoesterase family protein [Deltaproteobacteria bacterium]
MVIAIMSDSHDNIWNVRKALELTRAHKAELIVHCGDLVAPFTLMELAQFDGPVHWVLGNNDGDPYMLTRISLTELKNMETHGLIGRLNLEGVSIGFTHYEEMGHALAHTGEYDLVCCGHTHAHRQERIHQTLLLNPGDVMGKDGPGTFSLFDTATRETMVLKLT